MIGYYHEVRDMVGCQPAMITVSCTSSQFTDQDKAPGPDLARALYGWFINERKLTPIKKAYQGFCHSWQSFHPDIQRVQ
ncbi:hypothetical protein [Spirosoma fluminis]